MEVSDTSVECAAVVCLCTHSRRVCVCVCSDVSVGEKEEEEEEEPLRQLTLDEWKALQHDKRPAANFNIRKPGEGCTSDPSWKKMEVLKKKQHDEAQMDSSGQFDDAVSTHGRMCTDHGKSSSYAEVLESHRK